jgi:hypothetical protein
MWPYRWFSYIIGHVTIQMILLMNGLKLLLPTGLRALQVRTELEALVKQVKATRDRMPWGDHVRQWLDVVACLTEKSIAALWHTLLSQWSLLLSELSFHAPPTHPSARWNQYVGPSTSVGENSAWLIRVGQSGHCNSGHKFWCGWADHLKHNYPTTRLEK